MPTPPPSPPPLTAPSPSPSPSSSASPGESPSPSPAATGLTVSPTTVALHPNGTATIAVSGATGIVSVTFSQNLATAKVDPVSDIVTVNAGAQTGTDTVHIADAAGNTADVPLRVALDAGTIPSTLTLKVTGSPVDPTWLAAQIEAFITRMMTVQPGAQATVTVPTSPAPLVGESVQTAVPVQIAGNGTYFDVTGTTNMTVRNVGVEPFAPPVLFYDDDPERIVADGLVYRGSVSSQTPARLYYYHDGGPDPRRLAVILTSQSQDPTSVQIIDASAGPNLDVMSVGHAVSKTYLSLAPRNEGIIVDLDAGEPYLLHDFALTAKAGVAGSVAMQVVSGGPVTVSVVAYSPGVNPVTLLAGPAAPPDGHHRTGVFSIVNFGTQSLAYTVGGEDTKTVYADRDSSPPNAQSGIDGHDFGDYGVLHTFLFSLNNPTAAPATVYLYERPIGGIVRSTFLVDGNLAEVGCVRLSVPYQIQAFELAAGGRYQVNVQTMTDGGSNYPLEVGMTATPPVASAPPISGPDGCFPKPGAPAAPPGGR